MSAYLLKGGTLVNEGQIFRPIFGFTTTGLKALGNHFLPVRMKPSSIVKDFIFSRDWSTIRYIFGNPASRTKPPSGRNPGQR